MKKVIKFILSILIIILFTGCELLEPFINPINPINPNPEKDDFYCVNSTEEINNTETPSYKFSMKTNYYDEVSDGVVMVGACYYVNDEKIEKRTSGFIVKKEMNDDTNKYYLVTSASGILYRYIISDYDGKSTFNISEYTTISVDGNFEILTNDGLRINVTLEAYNESSDIAILSFSSKKDYPVLEFADSDDLFVGDEIFAIGTPDTSTSLLNSCVRGYVSGLNRLSYISYTGLHNNKAYTAELCSLPTFQFDCPISDGMVGGPIFNEDCKVVGMVSYSIVNSSSSAYAESLSFGIYGNVIDRVSNELILNKTYSKPLLGVTVGNAELYQNEVAFIKTYDLYEGLYIVTKEHGGQEGISNGHAKEAGMKSNEVIVSCYVNEKFIKIVNLCTLSNVLFSINEGDSLKLNTVDSDGKSHTYEINLW